MSKEKECKWTSIGGSALIEGVMMRGKGRLALAIRRADGKIQMKVESAPDNAAWYNKIPILRGVISFVLSMMLSYKCLMYSADVSLEGLEEPEEPSKLDQFLEKLMGKTGMAILGTLSMILGLGLSLVLFIYLPALFTGWVMPEAGAAWKAVAEGLMKIAIFIGYIGLTSLLPDMRRVFQYHGGEHKSIFCYEAKEELNGTCAGKCSRFHPRCGTSFIFLTLLISIVVAMFIPWGNRLVRTGLKLLCVPVIMGLAYEFIRYAGRHDNWFTKILSAPGLWMQRITTKEPDEDQLRVALIALKGVLDEKYPLDQELFVDEDGEILGIKEEAEGESQS